MRGGGGEAEAAEAEALRGGGCEAEAMPPPKVEAARRVLGVLGPLGVLGVLWCSWDQAGASVIAKVATGCTLGIKPKERDAEALHRDSLASS